MSGDSFLRVFFQTRGKRLSYPASTRRVKTLVSLRGFVLTRYHFGVNHSLRSRRSGRLRAFERFPEIPDRPFQPLADRHRRLPPKFFLRKRDLRLPADRIVLRKGPEDDLGGGSGDLLDIHRQLLDAVLPGVAHVHRPDDLILVHHRDPPGDRVVHVAEGPGLVPCPVERDRLVPQRLEDKMGDHPPVVRVHPRPERIVDPDDPDVELVLAVVVEKERFGAPYPLVVAGAGSDRVDIRLGGLDGIELVVDGDAGHARLLISSTSTYGGQVMSWRMNSNMGLSKRRKMFARREVKK